MILILQVKFIYLKLHLYFRLFMKITYLSIENILQKFSNYSANIHTDLISQHGYLSYECYKIIEHYGKFIDCFFSDLFFVVFPQHILTNLYKIIFLFIIHLILLILIVGLFCSNFTNLYFVTNLKIVCIYSQLFEV